MTEAPIPSPTPPLEIAHVLFMDIVAYSTLHMDKQHQVLRELQEAIRNTSEFAHAAIRPLAQNSVLLSRATRSQAA